MTDAPAGQGALGGSHGRVSRFMGNLMIMENVAPSPLCLPLGLPETPGDLCPLMKSTCACLWNETHLRPLPPADAAPRLEVTVRGHGRTFALVPFVVRAEFCFLFFNCFCQIKYSVSTMKFLNGFFRIESLTLIL